MRTSTYYIKQGSIIILAFLTAFMPTASVFAQTYDAPFDDPIIYEEPPLSDVDPWTPPAFPDYYPDPIDIDDNGFPLGDDPSILSANTFDPTTDPLFKPMPENAWGTPLSYEVPLYDWAKPTTSYIENGLVISPAEIISDFDPNESGIAEMDEPIAPLDSAEPTESPLDDEDFEDGDPDVGIDDIVVLPEDGSIDSSSVGSIPAEEGEQESNDEEQEPIDESLYQVQDSYTDVAKLPNGKTVVRLYKEPRMVYESEDGLKVRPLSWSLFHEQEESKLRDNGSDTYRYEIPSEQENIVVRPGTLERDFGQTIIEPEAARFDQYRDGNEMITRYSGVYPGVDISFHDIKDYRQRAIVINEPLEGLDDSDNAIFWETYSLPEESRVSIGAEEYLEDGYHELPSDIVTIEQPNGDKFAVTGAIIFDQRTADPVSIDMNPTVVDQIVHVDRGAGELRIGLKAPGTYLNDPERAYPVIIDPYNYICKDNSSQNIKSCSIEEVYLRYKTSNSITAKQSNKYLLLGYIYSYVKPTGPSHRQPVMRFMKNDKNFFPNLKNYGTLDKAKLYMRRSEVNGSGSYTGKIPTVVRRIYTPSTWHPNWVTFNYVGNHLHTISDTTNVFGNMKEGASASWDITALVGLWMTGTTNNGFLIQPTPVWNKNGSVPTWPKKILWFRSSKHPDDYGPYIRFDFTEAKKPNLTKQSDNLTGWWKIANGVRYFRPGDKMTIKATVKNEGPGSAGSSSYVKYYLRPGHSSSKPQNQYYLSGSQDYVPNLSQGSTSNESYTYTIPSNKPNGDYGIFYSIDANNNVSESDENDNIWFWNIRIEAEKKVNLVITDPTIQSSVKPGESVNVSGTVKNIGTSPSEKTKMCHYISKTTSKNNIVVDYPKIDPGTVENTSALSPGGKDKDSETLKIPTNLAPGGYYLLFEADCKNNQKETNENDNIGWKYFTVAQPTKPDLFLKNTSHNYTTRKQGEVLRVTSYVENKGDANAGTFKVGYYLSTDTSLGGDTLIGEREFSSGVAVGKIENRFKDLTIPVNQTPGNYYIIHVADYKGQISEKNENNNSAYRALTIKSKDEPTNLIAKSNTLLNTSKTHLGGQTVQMQATIENKGTNSANNIKVKLQLENTKTGSFVVLKNVSPPGVTISGNSTKTVTYTGLIENTCDLPLEGTYAAHITVNSNQAIGEITYKDNIVKTKAGNTIKVKRYNICTPKKFDEDNDGFYDSEEFYMGSDPMSKESIPIPASNFEKDFSLPVDYAVDNFGGDPVNLRTGAIEFTQTDYTLDGRGIPINISRTYNSRLAHVSSTIGTGWNHSYNLYAFQDPNTKKTFVNLGGSKAIEFTTSDGGKTFSVERGETGTLYSDNGVLTYKLLNGTKYRFTKSLSERLFLLTEIVDTFGNTTKLNYKDIRGLQVLESIADASGRKVTFKHGEITDDIEWNKIVAIEDTVANTNKRHIAYSYDDKGRLTEVKETRRTGNKTDYAVRKFGYDDKNRMTTYTDPRGSILYNTYDGNNRIIEQHEHNPLTENPGEKHLIFKLSYTGANAQIPGSTECTTLTSYRDTEEKDLVVDQYCFDKHGNKIAHKDGEGNIEKWKYHDNDLVVAYTDKKNRVTSYNYDGLKRLQTTILPDSDKYHTEIHYTYEDTFNRVKQMEEKVYDLSNKLLGTRITSNVIDSKTGAVTESTDVLKNKESFTYDQYGNVLTHINKNKNKTTFTYDEKGNYLTKQSTQWKKPLSSTVNTHSVAYEYDDHGNLTKKTYADGKSDTYTYDSAGNALSHTDRQNATYSYSYDVENHRISEKDPLGTATTFTYDKDLEGRLIKIETTSGGKTITETTDYDLLGNVLRETDALSRAISYEYDKVNRLVKELRPYHTKTFTYDVSDNLTKEITDKGHKTEYAYDKHDQLIETKVYTSPTAFVLAKSSYDHFGREVSATDGNNNSTIFTYDLADQLLTKVDAEKQKTSYFYDAEGNIIGELSPRAQADKGLRNPNGHSITYKYNELGLLSQRIDADGKATSFIHNADGTVAKQIDRHNADGTELSRSQTFTYDGEGRILTAADPSGEKEVYTYDAVGNLKTIKDKGSRTTTMTYDGFGRLTQQKDPSGAITTYTYDNVGNRKTVKLPSGQITNFEYDKENRLVKTTDPLKGASVYTYDVFGNRTSIQDPRKNKTSFTYDLGGQLVEEVDAQGTKIIYTYDKNGNRLTQDVAGKKTSYVFDKVDRVTKVTHPGNVVETFAYNADGLVREQTNGNNVKTAYTYDNLGRTVKKQFADNSTYTFGYDQWSNVKKITDDVGTIDYTYSNRNEQLSEKRTFSDLNKSFTVARTYTPNGLLKDVTDAAGKKIDYVYDNRAALKSVAHKSKILALYTYSSNGTPTKVTYGNGVTNNIAYDELDRVGSFAIKNSSGNNLFTHAYTYDGANNRTKTVENGTRTIEYTYDGLDQLKTEKITDKGNVYSFGFDYDKWGNRSALTSPHQKATYAYTNGTDRLEKTAYNDRLSVATTYDKNGNVAKESFSRLGKDLRSVDYVWNAKNQLQSISYTDKSRPSFMPALEKNSMTFAYDFAGNRAKKKANNQTTYYINNGVLVQNEINGSGLVTLSLVQGLDTVARINAAGTIEYIHQDALGSTVLITDANEKVVEEYEYTPFGEIAGLGNGNHSYLFTGQEYDIESDLHYYNARYYNPRTGRFLSRDPFMGVAGSTLSRNAYIYVENNPLKHTDSTGLWFGIDDLIAAGVGAVVGVAAQAVSDLATSAINGKLEFSSWQTYTGAAVGGAAAGTAFLYTGPVGSALVYGAVSNATTQGLNIATGVQDSFDTKSFVTETVASGVLGGVGGKILPKVAPKILPKITSKVLPKVTSKVNTAINTVRSKLVPKATKFTQDTLKSLKNTKVKGVYDIVLKNGKHYVGQSKNIANRLLQHIKNKKFSLDDIANIKIKEVVGGKTAREIVEQRIINSLGGIRGGNLLNVVNPIGKARQYLMNQAPKIVRSGWFSKIFGAGPKIGGAATTQQILGATGVGMGITGLNYAFQDNK